MSSGSRSEPYGAGQPRPPGALILGGDHGSLGAARSLGRKGIPVWYISDDKWIARYSRYVERSLAWAGPLSADAVDFLLALAHTHGLDGWVLLPAGDREVALVAQNHERLSSVFRVVTAHWQVLQDATVKSRMYARAAECGVPVPRTYEIARKQDLGVVGARFPVIVKPSMKEESNAFTRAKAWIANSPAELDALYDAATALVPADKIVVQELVPGGGSTQFSYVGVWHACAPVVSAVVLRRRQFPVEIGTGTFAETVDNPEIEELAARFLRSIAFDGMVEIEFKYDRRDRSYKILDVNPRIWTWNSIGLSAGIDCVHTQWLLACGRDAPLARGRAGVGWLYALKDVLAAAELLMTGQIDFHDYLTSLGKVRQFAAFSWDDPLPAVVDLPLAIATSLRRAGQKLTRRVHPPVPPILIEE